MNSQPSPVIIGKNATQSYGTRRGYCESVAIIQYYLFMSS